jgi:acyl-CoA synthetase (AMP-forming)/AMP-acid ligase II
MPIQSTAATFPMVVCEGARKYPSREVLVDNDQRLTYEQLESAMLSSAAAAAAAGIGPGDRVAIWAPNSAVWVVAALGAQANGAAIVPMTTRFRGEEAAFVLHASGAKLLFTVTGFLGQDYPKLLRSAAPELAELPIVLLDGESTDGDLTWLEYLARADDFDPDSVRRMAEGVSDETVSDVMFTSGTTGTPKGVLTTHAQNLLAWRDYAECLLLDETDRALVVLPLSHNFGFKAGFISCAMVGACAVMLSVFDEVRVMGKIASEGITILSGTPTLLQGVLDHPERASYDLSTLRKGTVAGSTVSVDLVERLQSEGLLRHVMNGYGLSESAGGVALSEPDDDPDTVANWCGRIRRHVEVRVVDDNLDEVPPGAEGEILVRAATVMLGYYDQPDKTAEAIDAEGFLHTGDIGLVENGYLKITGRKKDMFIVGGFNTYPAEIELALLEHPDIADAAVVGVPDDRLGEVGAAFIVARPGSDITAEDVTAWSRERLANYKVPRYVEFTPALPRNIMLKIEKVVLRDQALANIGRSAAAAPGASGPSPVLLADRLGE